MDKMKQFDELLKLIYTESTLPYIRTEVSVSAKFPEVLAEFFEVIGCNCFFENNEVKEKLKSKIEEIEIIERNHKSIKLYKSNFGSSIFDEIRLLAFGFLYLFSGLQEKAYGYLTKRIDNINKSEESHITSRHSEIRFLPMISDFNLLGIFYELRCQIREEINSDYLSDGLEAIIRNPSARNYFIVANSISGKKKHLNEEINYLKIAIKLNPKFECAYNNLGIAFKNYNEKVKKMFPIEDIIFNFKTCLKLNPKHWCYFNLGIILFIDKNYEEAIKVAKRGFLIYQNEVRYYYLLGRCYSKISKSKLAVKYFKLAISKNCEVEKSKKWLEYNENELKLLDAKRNFKLKKYDKSLDLFSDYLKYKYKLRVNDNLGENWEDGILNTYLYGTMIENEGLDFCLRSLLIIKKNIKIDSQNKRYIHLKELMNSGNFEISQNVRKLKNYEFGDYLNFGKYEGEAVGNILLKDSEYLLWTIKNLEHFSVDNIMFSLPFLWNQKFFIEALEENMVKNIIIEEYGLNRYDVEDSINYSDEDIFRDGFDSDIDAWNHYNQ